MLTNLLLYVNKRVKTTKSMFFVSNIPGVFAVKKFHTLYSLHFIVLVYFLQQNKFFIQAKIV